MIARYSFLRGTILIESNIKDRLNDKSADLQVYIEKNTVSEKPFDTCADEAVAQIQANHKNLYVAYSGGLDSEYVMKAFLRNGVDFKTLIVKTEGNREELEFAYQFCRDNSVTPMIIEKSSDEMLEVYYHYIYKKLNGIGYNSTASLILSQYIQEIGGTLVVGEHVVDNPNGEIVAQVNEWDFYNDAFTNNTLNFFMETPELVYQMVKSIHGHDLQKFKSELYGLKQRPKLAYEQYKHSYYKAMDYLKRMRTSSPKTGCFLGTKDEFLKKYFTVV